MKESMKHMEAHKLAFYPPTQKERNGAGDFEQATLRWNQIRLLCILAITCDYASSQAPLCLAVLAT